MAAGAPLATRWIVAGVLAAPLALAAGAGLAAETGTLSSTAPYDAHRQPPAGGEVAAVPALAERPLERLPEPELVPGGSPSAGRDVYLDTTIDEDVSQIAMSRDGRQGWAVGANGRGYGAGSRVEDRWSSSGSGRAVLYRFDGSGWARCELAGVPGQLDPDPARASLAGLLGYKVADSPYERRVQLTAVARVPLERDPNPSNDDDFELVAIGGNYRGPEQPADDDPVIVRYRSGRWDFEPRAARVAVTAPYSRPDPDNPSGASMSAGKGQLILDDVAFTAPNDGWILARSVASGADWYPQRHRLFHFDGRRWEECLRETGAHVAGACGSVRIPQLVSEAVLRLTSAGERVYLYGKRGGWNDHAAPLILYHERGGEWTDGQGPGEDGAGLDPACASFDKTSERWKCLPGGAYSPEDRTLASFGFNPRLGTGGPEQQGRVWTLAVTQRPDGSYEGLALGRFYKKSPSLQQDNAGAEHGMRLPAPSAFALRLVRDGGRYRWRTFEDPGALGDHLNRWAQYADQQGMALLGGPGSEPSRLLVQLVGPTRLYTLAPGRSRSETVATDLPAQQAIIEDALNAQVQAIAPDSQGGAWLAFKKYPTTGSGGAGYQPNFPPFFYHYTDRPPKVVFTETPHPFADADRRITALTGTRDGTVWVATDSSLLARYDRMTGWETVKIPGWDAGDVVSQASASLFPPAAVNALAVGDDGRGIAAGVGGRIANIDPGTVRLNPATGRRCADRPPPCGTARDLYAAAVAPGGSALAGGDGMAVLWRPAGGDFRAVAAPPGGADGRITSISYPRSDRAYLTTVSGYVYAGEMASPGEWSWRAENLTADGTVLGATASAAYTPASKTPLTAVAVDAQGHGYAVGGRILKPFGLDYIHPRFVDSGLVLYRTGDGPHPWKRIRGAGGDDLTSVALARGGGGSVLIGGRHGVVWTGRGERLAVARPGDFFRYVTDDRPVIGPGLVGPVAGLALLPGAKEGQVEAWAVTQARGKGTNRLLHYASDESEPLLNPDVRAAALPDSPAKRPGELSFAAFGKSDCDNGSQAAPSICGEMLGSAISHEVMARRVVAELVGRARRGAGPDFSLFTGDTADNAGYPSNSTVPFDKRAGNSLFNQWGWVDFWGTWAWIGRLKLRRWTEWVADPLNRAGAPLFGAIGPGDLSRPAIVCYGGYSCNSYAEPYKTGENLAWRQAMEHLPVPWGLGEESPRGGTLRFLQTPHSEDGAQRLPAVELDPDGEGWLPKTEFRGGARTHYSVEVVRGGKPVARLIVIDTSLRSLAAADPIQQPVEPAGQLAWLERMLCVKGDVVSGAVCTREPGQPAIVLSNTPTYSYGPGAGDATEQDATALEALLLANKASVVVSGRLGWNARYWATAPGVHEPCPGGEYQTEAPASKTRVCGRTAPTPPAPPPGSGGLAGALNTLGAPPDPESAAGALGDVVPFVIASGAGGKFGPNGEQGGGKASDGYWHGYTTVRVPADGDPRGVIVEQRPILDWIAISGQTRVLRPGKKLLLRGVGREPIAYQRTTSSPATRIDDVNTPAITHRYDLVRADPERPYVPERDADGNYVPLDPAVGTIDPQSGLVQAGKGKQGRTYAIAILSVGVHVASYPLVFEPRKSYVPKPVQALRLPPRPKPAPEPPAPIRVLSVAGQVPPAPQPPPSQPPPPSPPIALPSAPSLAQPAVPAPPPLPGLTAPSLPAPPHTPAATTLDLTPSVQALSVVPAAVPVPPLPVSNPVPPVQPAPPEPARRKKVAISTSGLGGGPRAEIQKMAGDLAQQPSGAEGAKMTRRDTPHPATRREPARPAPSFTPAPDDLRRPRHSFAVVARADQPSAWARGALYGAGLTIAALALATGFATPRPRRRPPVVPAPAWARAMRRRN